jgi:SagB-type dehydrogenase family enzyme
MGRDVMAWSPGRSFMGLPLRTEISLRPGTRLEAPRGLLRLMGSLGGCQIRDPGAGETRVLRSLIREAHPLSAVLAGLAPDERRRFAAVLHSHPFLFTHSIRHEQRVLMVIEPTACTSPRFFTAPEPDAPVRLGRFSFLRTAEGHLVLESAIARYRITFTDRDAEALIGTLGAARTPRALTTAELPPTAVSELIGHLLAAGMLDSVTGSDVNEGDEDLTGWSFPDLLFHARSRAGTHDRPTGGLYPFRGHLDPLPAIKPRPEGAVTALPVPDWRSILSRDPPLLVAQEARESRRQHAAGPLSREELGEFLYRVARVRSMRSTGAYDISSRPYPSAGAAYDLEFYLTIDRCDEIAPGAYFYDPVGHALVLINDSEACRTEQMARAARSAGLDGSPPQALITLSSRFLRLSWKYVGIAYRLTLLNVGVAYQTMYLVATAMGLAGCALGTGESAVTADWLGLHYASESPVGEFLLGSPLEVRFAAARETGVAVNDAGWAATARSSLGHA